MQMEGNKAKYYKLKEYLKEEIMTGKIKPGDQILSENMLSAAFSVSRHTVRKAIAVLVNEGYLYTEHGRGTYCLDRTKKRSDSKNVGIIVTYISEYIFPRLINGIDSVLSKSGYSMILKNTNNDIEKESRCLEDMFEKNMEGLIIEPTKSALFCSNLKLYEALDNYKIPYVFIHGYYQELEEKPRVILDDTMGTYSVVNYLAGLGHKNMIGIFKADDIQGINRHKGYAKALAQNGLHYDPENVIWYNTEDKYTKPYTALRSIIETGIKTDAIVCYNDEIAVRVFELLCEMGIKVPEDISITGFDDSYLAVSCPVKLTTVSHPKEKLGEAAAELLLDMLKDSYSIGKPVKKTITPELIIRDSCIKR